MKKVNELLNLGNKYHLVIGNYFGTKEYGIVSKRTELTEAVKDFVKDEGNGRHNISATLHEAQGTPAIAQTDLEGVIELSIKER